LKALLADSFNFSMDDRFYFFLRFSKKLLNKSISFLRRSCVISGYAKAVFCRFFLCRHKIKRYASGGFVSGMRKSSF
jgi:ribosomal protein S14